MSREYISLLALTVSAAGALAANTMVGHDGNPASAAGNALGVARTDAATGEDVAVDVIGTAVVLAGGVIAAGAAVEVGTAGKVVTKAAGITVGRLAPGSSAAADGDLVEMILIAN